MSNHKKLMRIPKEFVLFGHTYRVVLVKDLYETESCYGIADEDARLIKLQDVGKVMKRYEDEGKQVSVEIEITPETLMETFFHEIVHIMLDSTVNDTLSSDEKFVTIMGKAMLEIYLSSVYEKDSS